jgi:integrase
VLEQQRDMQRFEARRADYVTSDYVFTRPRGCHYHPQTVSKALARLSQRAGLPRLTAHGLRHTSATLMLDSGVPPKVAAERLGHADPTLFTNLYSHVTPTMQRDAAVRLGHALFGEVRR